MDNDLIRREDAISAAKTGADDWDGGCNKNRDVYIEKALTDIPAVDAVEVRYGRWIVAGYDLTCSECKELYVFDEYLPDLDMDKDLDMRYCPSCGARMDGRREDR